MSPRERWIVYPLLFFSFGLAIRDQVPDWQSPPEFNIVRCRHLIVEDELGGPAVDIHSVKRGSNAGSGVITVYADSPKVGTSKAPAVRLSVTRKRLGVAEKYGAVETFGPMGSPATQLIGVQQGGTVRTFDPTGKPRLPVEASRIVISGAAPEKVIEPDENDPRQATPRPPVPPSEDDSDEDTEAEAQDDAADGAS